MKRIALTLAFGTAVLASGNLFASGWPVIDIMQITNNQINQAANIAKYIEMIAHHKQQIEQLKNEYNALTGNRRLGMILNDPAFRSALPDEWKEVYDGIQNGGYSGLSNTARNILDTSGLLDACDDVSDAARAICERQVAKAAQDKANAMEAFDNAQARWDQIQALMGQINATTDPKAIAELQARINAEQAAIQNEQTKLQMFAMAAQIEDRLMEQRELQQTREELRRRGWVNVRPLSAKRVP